MKASLRLEAAQRPQWPRLYLLSRPRSRGRMPSLVGDGGQVLQVLGWALTRIRNFSRVQYWQFIHSIHLHYILYCIKYNSYNSIPVIVFHLYAMIMLVLYSVSIMCIICIITSTLK